MNIQIVIFSFLRDKKLLEQNLEHIKLLADKSEHAVKVHVADEEGSPCFASEADAIAAGTTSYERTTFGRGVRLNGLDCLDGMLSVYRRCVESDPAIDWIVQLDCDTIIQHFSWIEECPDNVIMSGCQLDDLSLDFCFGPTLAMRPAGLDCIDSALGREGIRERLVGSDVYTDRVMTYLAEIGGGRIQIYRNSKMDSGNISGVCFATYPGFNSDIAPLFSHVCFEKRMLIAPLEDEEKVDQCADLMRLYLA